MANEEARAVAELPAELVALRRWAVEQAVTALQQGTEVDRILLEAQKFVEYVKTGPKDWTKQAGAKQ